MSRGTSRNKCSLSKMFLGLVAACVVMIVVSHLSTIRPFRGKFRSLTKLFHARRPARPARILPLRSDHSRHPFLTSGHLSAASHGEDRDLHLRPTRILSLRADHSQRSGEDGDVYLHSPARIQHLFATSGPRSPGQVEDSDLQFGGIPHNVPSLKSHGEETKKRIAQNVPPQKADEDETKKPTEDPYKKQYLFRGFTGRMGNIMFQTASAFCIASRNNLTLVVQNSSALVDFAYSGIILSTDAWSQLRRKLSIKALYGGFCHEFKSEYLNRLGPSNYSYSLSGYLQSWKYFDDCKTEVKQALRFNENIVAKAVNVIRRLKEKFPRKALVGVHVRMEDFLRPNTIYNGKRVAPPSYYIRAMTYFREKLLAVRFVVITSNQAWFRANVTTASDVMFLERSDSAAVDMEMLSRMDHLIYSVGTFGWWAGYKKSKGIVVCYKDFFTPNTRFGNQFINGTENFIYPGWIQL